MNYDSFIDYMRDRNLAAQSIYDYGNTFKRFFSIHAALDEASVKAFLSGHAPATRKKLRIHLRRLAEFYSITIDWDRSIPTPKVHREAPVVVSQDDETTIIRYFRKRNPRFAKLLQFLILTGLRVNEAANLRAEDRRELTIDGTTHCYLVIRKQGSHSIEGRNVPLTPESDILLRSLRLPLQFDRRRFNDMLVAARKAHDLPHYKIHSLRKTFMSRALARGVNVLDLANIMGHQDTKTMLHYASKTPQTLVAAFIPQKVGVL